MDWYTEGLNQILTTTENRKKLRDLLDAWDKKGLPSDFHDDGSRIAYNSNSRLMFIVNNDYQTAMLKGDTLQSYYSLPHDGHEGFLNDLIDALNGSWHTTDVGALIRLVNDVGTDEQKAALFDGKLTDDSMDFESYYEIVAEDTNGNRYVTVDDESLSIVNGKIIYGEEAFYENANGDYITKYDDDED